MSLRTCKSNTAAFYVGTKEKRKHGAKSHNDQNFRTRQQRGTGVHGKFLAQPRSWFESFREQLSVGTHLLQCRETLKSHFKRDTLRRRYVGRPKKQPSWPKKCQFHTGPPWAPKPEEKFSSAERNKLEVKLGEKHHHLACLGKLKKAAQRTLARRSQ